MRASSGFLHVAGHPASAALVQCRVKAANDPSCAALLVDSGGGCVLSGCTMCHGGSGTTCMLRGPGSSLVALHGSALEGGHAVGVMACEAATCTLEVCSVRGASFGGVVLSDTGTRAQLGSCALERNPQSCVIVTKGAEASLRECALGGSVDHAALTMQQAGSRVRAERCSFSASKPGAAWGGGAGRQRAWLPLRGRHLQGGGLWQQRRPGR